MGTELPGHAAPAAGFDAPLDMLGQCHRRFEQQCSTLQRLATHLPPHGADAQAQQAATAVMRYFDSAARHHHEDEEQDLFPALIESLAGSDARCLREITGTLAREHRVLESLWVTVRGDLQSIGTGRSARLDADALQALVTGYRAHIAREEAELLPMAARLLDDVALRRLGSAMRRRRGIAEGD